MVRGFNPSQDDPVKHLFDSVFRLFKKREQLTPEATKMLVQRWFAADAYHNIFELFRQRNLAAPKIRLLSNCSYQHFPSQWDAATNTIGVCMKNISNKIELKENIDRQLHLAYAQTLHPSGQSDVTAMTNLYTSCRAQYRNYEGLSEELLSTLSQKCAKYLFMQRRQHRFPLDSQFRLASRLSRSMAN